LKKELLDHLFADYTYQNPENLIWENGVLKQLTQKLFWSGPFKRK